jgi:hypothetical protein
MTFLLSAAFDSRGAHKKASFFHSSLCFPFLFVWTVPKRPFPFCSSKRRPACKSRSRIYSAHFNHEDGGSKFLRNVDNTVQFHTVLPPMINITMCDVYQFFLFLVDICPVSTFIFLAVRTWSISWPLLYGIILFCKKYYHSSSYPKRVLSRHKVLISVDSNCFCVYIKIQCAHP